MKLLKGILRALSVTENCSGADRRTVIAKSRFKGNLKLLLAYYLQLCHRCFLSDGPLSPPARLGHIPLVIMVLILCGVAIQHPVSAQATTDVISNGGFEQSSDGRNITNWSTGYWGDAINWAVPPTYMYYWTSLVYEGVASGSLFSSSYPTNSFHSGRYFDQAIAHTINAGATVQLAYAYRFSAGSYVNDRGGGTHDMLRGANLTIQCILYKPDGSSVVLHSDVWSTYSSAASSWKNTWTDVSSYFDQTGQYRIRLQFEGTGSSGGVPIGLGSLFDAVHPFVNETSTLTITRAGTGSGTVTSDTGTITWSGNTGSASYWSSTNVTLTATADPSSVFAGWSGNADCSDGQVMMNGNIDCTATFNTATLTDGLVAYYTFNGNANDESGNGNNGTVNGATLTTDRFGNPNSAYSFDGASGFIEANDSSTLDITNVITVSAWIYIDDSYNGDIRYIVDKYFDGATYSWLLSIENFKARYYNAYGVFPTGKADILYSNITLQRNQWYFITAVTDDTRLKLYINGVLDAEMYKTGTLGVNNKNLVIGKSYDENSFFNGSIDDVRIYNRALSAEEIRQLHSKEIGLVAYYPFNGNANDESGNGNNGTVNGATLTTDRFGNPNKAYSFVGDSSTYIRVPRSSLLEPPTGMSISYWMLKRGSGINANTVMRKADNCGAGFISWIGSGSAILNIAIDGPSVCNNDFIYVYTDISTYLNRWDHYAYVYDTTNGLKLYRNGIMLAAHGPLSPTMSHSGDLYIGGSVVHPGDGGLNGDLDDIRIYNRALTTTEIQKLYTGAAIQLPRTGQTKCYNASGTEISCAGTGQDGAIQSGVAWPNPRFTDNGDQTVTDNLTGLVWTKDAGTPTVTGTPTCAGGAKTWQGALDYVACLNANNYLGHNDWRLPNVNELKSLVTEGQSISFTWLPTQGFTNVQGSAYWSSNTDPYSTDNAWLVHMWFGYVYYYHKSYPNYIWPVRAGQCEAFGNSAICLPQTGQTKCYSQGGANISCVGTGQDGELRAGVSWPDPRFTDNLDQTLTDNLTGLIWTKDASTPAVSSCLGGTKTWQGALDYVACLNATNYLGHNDWRLPNVNELRSLVNAEQSNSATWLNTQGFANVQSGGYQSSTTQPYYTDYAWIVYMWYGRVNHYVKSNSYYVWPVRAGIVIANTAPVSQPSGPYVTDLGAGVTFNGAASYDPDSGDSIVGYSWSIAGGTYTLSGSTPSLTAAQVIALGAGTYPVVLTVSDSRGATGTASTTLTVNMSVFTIAVWSGAGGSVNCTPNPVNYGSSSTCTITPNTGYHIASVTVDSNPQSATSPYIFSNVTMTHTIAATFTLNQHTLTVNAMDSGSGVVGGGGIYGYGTSHDVTATAKTGSTFTGWSGDCLGTSSPYSVTMLDRDMSCTAIFTLNQYNLNVIVNTSGTGSGTVGGSGTFDYGTTHQLTATASPGSTFTGWTGDCSGTSSPFDVTMLDRDMSCTATFTLNQYTVNGLSTGNGSVNCSSPVNYSTQTTCTVTAALGYHILSVSGCGGTWTGANPYTTGNITGDCDVSGTFEADPANIEVTPSTSPVSFGDTHVGQTSSAKTFTVSNTGNMPLGLGTVAVTGTEFGKTNDNCTGQSIAPAGTCTFQVTFNPAGYGPRGATLSIPSDDADTPEVSLTLEGTGIASNIGVLPASPVSFGSVSVGSGSAAQQFTISNTGNENLELGTIDLDNVLFAKGNDTCSGAAIAPGGTCTVEVIFTPVTYGAETAILSIPSNDPDTSIQNIALNATGTASDIGVSPASPVDFGSINAGYPSPARQFTVVNTGNAGLTLGTIGSSNPEYAVQNDLCSNSTIAADTGTCTFEVVLTPEGSGTRTANLSIPSNDPDATTVVIALTGNGIQYTVTGTASGNGTVNCQSPVNYNTVASCAIIPGQNHNIVSVIGCGGNWSGSSPYVTGNITEDCQVIGTFAIDRYNLTTGTTGTGAGSIGGVHNPYDHGSTATITANAEIGSTFAVWSGCSNSATTTIDVLMDGSKTCVATFTLNLHTLTVNVDPASTGSGAVGGGGVFDYGTTHQATAVANTGSTFTGWTGDCSGTSSPYSVTMRDREMACTATFTLNPHTLTVNVDPASTGSGTVGGGGVFDYGTTHQATAVANTGSTFAGWTGDCSGTDSPIDVLIDNEKTCIATFALNQYALTVSKSGTGSGTVTSSPAGIECGSDCAETYDYNSAITLTASPATGSNFTGWSGDCSGVETCLVTVDAAKSITAIFSVNHPPVLIPIGDQPANEGQTLSFTVSATDPDGDTLTYSASNLPAGAVFDPATRTFTWTPTYTQAGEYKNIEFTVMDNGTPMELATELITITVSNVNRSPVFVPIGSQVTIEEQAIQFNVIASDPDGNNISYSTGALPQGAAFNETSGSFTWTPNFSQAGNYIVVFNATDNGIPRLTTQMEVSITVGDVPTPTELTTEIIDTVYELPLPPNVENAYMANLKKVNIFIEDNKFTPAINELNAFIGKVNRDILQGKIDQTVGNDLIIAANNIISLLRQQ